MVRKLKKEANLAKSKSYRDAGTGRYITKQYADRHPKTTVSETVKKK